MVVLLMDRGANINEVLRSSIYNDNIEIVKLFLDRGGKADANNLNYAISSGNVEIVELLLNRGGEADASHLKHAVSNENIEMVKLLLAAGIYPNDEDILLTAVEKKCPKIVEILLEAGADPKARDSEAFRKAFVNDYKEIVDLFLKYGVEEELLKEELVRKLIKNNEVDEFIARHKTGELNLNDERILNLVFYFTKYEFIKYCMKHISDEQRKEVSFVSILINSMDDEKLVKLCLENINPDEINKYEIHNILFTAIRHNNLYVAKYCLDKRNDLQEKMLPEAYITAFVQDNFAMIDLFKSYGVKPEVMALAKVKKCIASSDFDELVRIHKEGEFDFSDLKIVKALLYSLKYEFMKYGLENISDIQKSQINFTNLIIESFYQDDIICELLINSVDIKTLNNAGELLCEATSKGKTEFVKLMLEQCETVTMEKKVEAFIAAFLKGCDEIVDLLLKNGVDRKEIARAQIIKMIHDEQINPLLEMLKSGELDYTKSEVIKEILLSKEHVLVKYLFDHVPELKDAYLIGVGLNYTRGETTGHVLEILSQKLKAIKNAYYVEISLEIAQDEEIMQYMSGLINPGASDSYPEYKKPFKLEEMPFEKRMYHEKVYQEVITMAKKYDIPYLGICAGSQHLVLNGNGSLKQGGHGGSK